MITKNHKLIAKIQIFRYSYIMSMHRSFFKVEFLFFSKVFARTLLCDNLKLATQTASTHGLDCITYGGLSTVPILPLFFFILSLPIFLLSSVVICYR